MDFTDALKAGGASATLIMVVGVLVKVIQSFCGHRIRSECCGRSGTIGVSIEDISPKPKLEIPPPAERAVCVDLSGVAVSKK